MNNQLIKCSSFFVLGIISCGKPSNVSSNSQFKDITLPWESSAKLDVGKGIDIVNETVRGNCVEFSELADPVGGNRKAMQWSMDLVEDSKSFDKKLQVSATAGLKATGGSGSVKARELAVLVALLLPLAQALLAE